MVLLHYLASMTSILILAIFFSLWIFSLGQSLLSSKYFSAILFFFIPPIGMVYSVFFLIKEKMSILYMTDMDAFKVMLKSLRIKPKPCSKKR